MLSMWLSIFTINKHARFFTSFEAYKVQDLLEEVKNGCNEFKGGKKNILGQGVLELCYCLYNMLFYSNFFNILLLLTTQILFVF